MALELIFPRRVLNPQCTRYHLKTAVGSLLGGAVVRLFGTLCGDYLPEIFVVDTDIGEQKGSCEGTYHQVIISTK